MKIKMVQDEIINFGPQRLFAGQIVELPDAVASSLIASGKAVSLKAEKAKHSKAGKIAEEKSNVEKEK